MPLDQRAVRRPSSERIETVRPGAGLAQRAVRRSSSERSETVRPGGGPRYAPLLRRGATRPAEGSRGYSTSGEVAALLDQRANSLVEKVQAEDLDRQQLWHPRRGLEVVDGDLGSTASWPTRSTRSSKATEHLDQIRNGTSPTRQSRRLHVTRLCAQPQQACSATPRGRQAPPPGWVSAVVDEESAFGHRGESLGNGPRGETPTGEQLVERVEAGQHPQHVSRVGDTDIGPEVALVP